MFVSISLNLLGGFATYLRRHDAADDGPHGHYLNSTLTRSRQRECKYVLSMLQKMRRLGMREVNEIA